MFDYMFSADVFVDDMAKQTKLLVGGLDIHPPSPKAIVTDSPEAHATMLRLQRSFGDAPTRLEVIQPALKEGHWNVAHIQQAWSAQAAREIKFHNTVYVCDVDQLIDDLERRGVPYVVDASVAFRRLWIGISADRIDHYDPSYDAGLRVEVLPIDKFPVPAPSTAPSTPGGGPAVTRVLRRAFLVDDLDEAVRTLDQRLGWTPDTSVASDPEGKVVTYSMEHPRSASLELVEPNGGESAAGRFAAANGAGVYTTTFAVRGFDAWPDKLAAAGIAATPAPPRHGLGPRLVIDPGPLGAIKVELVSEDA